MNCGKDVDWHGFDCAIDCFEDLGWDADKYLTGEESGDFLYDVYKMRGALDGNLWTRFLHKCKWNYHYYIYDSCEGHVWTYRITDRIKIKMHTKLLLFKLKLQRKTILEYYHERGKI